MGTSFLWFVVASQMHQLGDKVMFYLEDPRAAKELSNVKTITSKDGPLVVTVYPSAPPKGIHDGGRGGGRGGGGGGGGGGHRRGAAPYERHRDKGGMDSSDDVVMEEGSAEVIQVHMCPCATPNRGIFQRGLIFAVFIIRIQSENISGILCWQQRMAWLPIHGI